MKYLFLILLIGIKTEAISPPFSFRAFIQCRKHAMSLKLEKSKLINAFETCRLQYLKDRGKEAKK